MQTKAEYIAEYKILRPVYRDFRSGRWGFEYICGHPDTFRCAYKTEYAAKCARARQAAAQYEVDVPMEDYYG